jgi:hypothetical protein
MAGTYSSIYIANVVLIWLNLNSEDLIPPAKQRASTTVHKHRSRRLAGKARVLNSRLFLLQGWEKRAEPASDDQEVHVNKSMLVGAVLGAVGVTAGGAVATYSLVNKGPEYAQVTDVQPVKHRSRPRARCARTSP